MSGLTGTGPGKSLANTPEIGDGLNALAKVINPHEIARLLGELTRWVDPETFRLLPVWFPETARKQPLYKAGWLEPQTNRDTPKFEGNTKANQTLARALGVATKNRPNWTCCHIWGNDDTLFRADNSEVNNPRYYSCPANMVLLPTPLKAFTDSVPEVKAALRIAAYRLYNFLPEGRALPHRDEASDWLPQGWGQGMVSGMVRMTAGIQRSASDRFETIRESFISPRGLYPFEQVKGVALYWAQKLPNNHLNQLPLGDT